MPAGRDAPVVSVVIVNWNAGQELLACLSSLQQHPPPVPWEVVVVDNASTDGSAMAIRRELPWVRLFVNARNRGLAAANNQGIVAARGDFVLVCNPDVVFRPGAIAAMLDTLGRHARAAWVVPRIFHPDGRLATSAGDLPTLAEALLGRQVQRHRSRGTPEGFWWDGWSHDEERAIGRGHECAYLIRREAIAEIGLQDERFRLDWEGIDWSWRAREAGWEIWLCPAAEVVHAGGVSVRQVPARWVVRSHRGMYRYFAKHRPPWQRPLLALAFGGRAAAKLVGACAGVASYDRGAGTR